MKQNPKDKGTIALSSMKRRIRDSGRVQQERQTVGKTWAIFERAVIKNAEQQWLTLDMGLVCGKGWVDSGGWRWLKRTRAMKTGKADKRGDVGVRVGRHVVHVTPAATPTPSPTPRPTPTPMPDTDADCCNAAMSAF